jgi:hypothetical protein
MIIAQGWKDKKIYMIVLSRATNGFDGWQLYRGWYDPNAGGSFETATWECMNSSHNVAMLLYDVSIAEIATWVDGPKQAKDIHVALAEIKGLCQQMATYVEAACRPSSPS